MGLNKQVGWGTHAAPRLGGDGAVWRGLTPTLKTTSRLRRPIDSHGAAKSYRGAGNNRHGE